MIAHVSTLGEPHHYFFRTSDVHRIKGVWVSGDNLYTYNHLRTQGLSAEDAARQTWTGQRAAEAGYTNVRVYPDRKMIGQHDRVEAYFTKP